MCGIDERARGRPWALRREGTYEDRTDRSDWRNVRGQTIRYLQFPQTCG